MHLKNKKANKTKQSLKLLQPCSKADFSQTLTVLWKPSDCFPCLPSGIHVKSGHFITNGGFLPFYPQKCFTKLSMTFKKCYFARTVYVYPMVKEDGDCTLPNRQLFFKGRVTAMNGRLDVK